MARVQDSQLAAGLALQRIPVMAPWEAYSIDSGAFPIEPSRSRPARSVVETVAAKISNVTGLSPDLFLQVAQLHVDGGSSLFATHAAGWNPSMGLGIFPDRDPPRTWKREDFEKLEPGQTVRPTSHKIFRLGLAGEERNRAWQMMFGRGATLQIYTPPPTAAFMDRTREAFLPKIEERIFRRYPFFVPLFDGRALESASAEQLAAWSCGFSAYIRESAEDQSILIVSRVPLGAAFEKAGLAVADAK